MRHMEIAWSQDGVTEVAGPGASTSVLNYFAANGRRDITSDEVPWCAAFYFWVLIEAGVDVSSIPPRERLLAFSATKLGTRLAGPRVGCGVVFPRRDKSGKIIGHHVGFVTAWTATTIFVLGGNQANSVCESEFKRRDDMIFMWPIPPATAAEVEAAGSRTLAAAHRQQKDGVKAGLPQGVDAAVPAPEAATSFPPPDALVAKVAALQGWLEAGHSFTMFAWGKLGWISLAITAYYLARMGWDAWRIRQARTADHNSGKAISVGDPAAHGSQGRAASAPAGAGWGDPLAASEEEVALV